MEYPIFLGGERAGTLRERAEGLYTVLEAELPGAPEQLLRLWIHGGGESAYLGLMEPGDGGLTLARRFSALERRKLPKQIAYASDRERPEQNSLHNIEPKPEPAPEQEETEEESHSTTENRASGTDRCPWPAPVAEETGDLLWLRRADGTLTAHDGISTLLALPAALRTKPRGTVLRRIEGKDYLVFRY